ncbi:FHA domain-containing protein [Streptomyces kanamyceticus]|uniref:FHA domain-containing protein n=1 Tax=Streptomyces kanamyceticus TaxID=1967 RepID=A0A5J6GFX8_STRKN|nr:FHA domain-containing protein [Streptomyces kanamyceticus]QEU94033.1 FHA domain-containing protein [Streptomyces kanamyceticus]
MQIRLTVLGPRSGQTEPPGRPTAPGGPHGACDVLVTAPAGTALAAVASGLATAVAGTDAPLVLYADAERLDAQRCTIGEPPLTDGAVLSLGAPAEPGPEPAGAAAQLHVVAGPDAGGVHLLHGGQIRVGRSAEADVPLDDPDVSRLHCAVTLADDGRVTVTDLGSTNGTSMDGREVTGRPVRLAPGSLLRIGESALRLADGRLGLGSGAGPGGTLPTAPDGEGHVRVRTAGALPPEASDAGAPRAPEGATHHAYGTASWGAAGEVARDGAHGGGAPGPYGIQGVYGTQGGAQGRTPGGTQDGPHARAQAGREVHDAYGAPAARGGPAGSVQGGGPRGSVQSGPAGSVPGGGPRSSAQDGPAGSAQRGGPGGSAQGGPAGSAQRGGPGGSVQGPVGSPHGPAGPTDPVVPQQGTAPDAERTSRTGTPARGTTVPRGLRKRGGLSAWARRLTGGRESGQEADVYEEYAPEGDAAAPPAPTPEELAVAAAARTPESWPDPAALLLTALGPGPRLWERGPSHPEALAVRLGTVDRAAPTDDGAGGLLPAVPVTVGLREAGALGLAGPRARLTGLARAVVAQLAALHSPDSLEIVLISTDRARPTAERVAEWAWLGWLPHLRPTHGQDCRLLLAYDRDQAAARTGELLRRLDDRIADQRAGADTAAPGPYTVVVVDGDPGSAGLREATVRLAGEGARAGIHVVCLAETVAASPASPVADTYEAACSVSPAFRACGAVALLSGDVATALRLLRTAGGRPAGHGTVAAVDAVSAAWAERFARALAPLRTDGVAGEGHARVSAPLPQAARLLDELGLARATPASLMARWAAAADDPDALGGRAVAVLGAGPRGPVTADLVADGPHLLAEGPGGSGRSELLRSVAASLAAAERPDRLGIVLVDGRDSTGAGAERRTTGLGVCTDLPHVTTHLVANDPVRMREFAQSLAAELKRRAELLGRLGFAEWHTQREVSGRMVSQRSQPSAASGAVGSSGATGAPPVPAQLSDGDLDPPTSATLRLRPAAARRQADPPPPLPRLVVLVDDFDALLSPALGSPGRPAAGSVVRALEAVARDGERLGVHLVVATGRSERMPETELGRRASLRVVLDAVASGPEEPAPGRGELRSPDGRVTAFQAGRVTGRIPRTSTLRPTVVPLEWERMGDPPARRPVRELGNGPTDLALLASALERAARSVSAEQVPSLL